MRARFRKVIASALAIAMISSLPVTAASGSETAKGGQSSNPWGINVDLSGVPGQVQATIANMIAQGEDPVEKETDAFLAEVVEEASGISFEAVKGSLGLELLSGAEGTMDTSRFNLGEEEFHRVMKEVLSEYFLTNVAYECDVEDGIVTAIQFMPASDAPSYRNMFTASDLWSMYRTPLTASALNASRLENDTLSEDEEEIVSMSEDEEEIVSMSEDEEENLPVSEDEEENLPVSEDEEENLPVSEDEEENLPVSEDEEENLPVSEDEEETDPEPANERTVTLQVKWKDNNKKANRPESVTVRLVDSENSQKYYDHPFDTVTDGKATIVVDDKDGDGNVIDYEIVEVGVEDGKLEGLNDTFYNVTTAQNGDTYTVTNTADGRNGEEYDVAFNWVPDYPYVDDDGNVVADKADAAMTLVYDAVNKKVTYGPKTTIDFKLSSVTLTSKDGSASITLDPTEENGVSYTTMYALGEYESLDRSSFGENAGYASTIKYGTYDCDYGTFEDRKDVTASAEAIHWNQMLAFTGDFAQHFGAAGDFWTSKNTERTPYGAFKTQIDSYPEDYIPDAAMDYAMEMMTLAYMADEMNYGSLLDQKIADCMAQLDGDMTPVQKYLVIHDWIANNAQFDMGVLVKTAAGTGNPAPAQMTAFGTLLSDAIPKDPQDPDKGTLDGCICLGYSATFAVLVQHAFPEIYQKMDENGEPVTDVNGNYVWKTASEVGDDDIVDLVQIRFYADLAEISVAGEDSGFGNANEMFGSVHYYNAVKVTQEDGTSSWYCIDPAYDDITTEVMDQCRVETKGNISHKYFMISPVNMLGMFEDSMDYIDCLYDGVVFLRTPNLDEEGNVIVDANGNPYKTETDKYGKEHVYWTQYNVEDVDMTELECDDDQYEATWFSGAVGEIAHDDNYWYYVTGPSFSYASMLNLMNQIKDYEGDMNMDDLGDLFSSDDPADKDRLVRRPRGAKDEPVKDGSSSGGGETDLGSLSSYDDPFDEILFHFGYGSVVPDEDVLDGEDEEAKQGDYYDQVLLDEAYYDMYPDLVHSMGLYNGVLYFNLGNKIYTMTGADKVTGEEEKLALEDVTIDQLKEYNDVYAKTDDRDFTGMSFYAVSKADYEKGDEDNAFHVFNRPIAAICIEDEVTYREEPIMGGPDGETVIGMAKVRDTVTPTLTVSIGTNFSESNKGRKDDDGNYVYGPYEPYTLEAVDYNPDYSKYTDDGSDPDVNDNEEFMWCANVVDTMPIKEMLADKASGEKAEVTINAWCGQDGYTEQRSAKYGLSDGTAKVTNKSDLALNHHYIKNELEECYICVHCNDSWHELPEDDEDYEALPEGATKDHYEDESNPTFVDIVWDEDDHSWCKAKIKCAERHCDHVMREIECDEITESTIKGSDGIEYPVITARYEGNVVDKEYPNGMPPYILGDVNGDGAVKANDLTLLTRYFAGYDVEIIKEAADINGDGAVKANDLTKLTRYFAGFDAVLGQ